jgi:hypothetical protein
VKNGNPDSKSLSRSLGKTGTCVFIALVCAGVHLGAIQGTATQVSSRSAGDFVAGIYGLVSSAGGKLPDWDKVRACFLRGAVVVLRQAAPA